MSFDDLLPLLFIAVIVVNAVRRGRKANRRTQAPKGAPKRPVRPSGSEDGRTAPDADDPLTRQLEEARRRVLEASGDRRRGGAEAAGPKAEPRPAGSTLVDGDDLGSLLGREGAPTASTGSGTGGGTGGGVGAPAAPTGTPAAPPRRPAPPPAASLGREGAAGGAHPAAGGSLGREGPPPMAPRRAPSARVAGARTQAAPSARLPAANVVGVGPDDVVRGVVWSVVLGEPAAARLRRRKVSPRRSP